MIKMRNKSYNKSYLQMKAFKREQENGANGYKFP